MKKNYILAITLITIYFSLNAQTNVYDTTLYEVGYYTESNNYPNTINPNQSFEDENWSFSINTPVFHFDYYEHQNMYLYEDIIVQENLNMTTQYIVSIEKEIPIMLNFSDLQVVFYASSGSVNGNGVISLYYYDITNNWVQSSLTFVTFVDGGAYVGSITNASKLKIEIADQLLGPFPNAEEYQIRKLRVLANKSTVNIQENITNNFNVYAYNKNLIVKTTEFEDYALTVYNLSGQEVFVKNTNGNQDIPLTLATGMYIVNINNGKESFNQKVVVQ